MKRLSDYVDSKCPENGCTTCVSMCTWRPCWGTPRDMEKIVKAGYGDRLMLDYWSGGFGRSHEDLLMLAPAVVGSEGAGAPHDPHGQCTFLTADGKCELHDAGLKPTEGRVADCQDEKAANGVHELVARSWHRSKRGSALIEEWRETR